MKKQYMAIDQYGHTYHGLTHPRRDLMNRLCCKHAEKMYVDTDEGAKHIGYVIAGLWLTLYEVKTYEKLQDWR